MSTPLTVSLGPFDYPVVWAVHAQGYAAPYVARVTLRGVFDCCVYGFGDDADEAVADLRQAYREALDFSTESAYHWWQEMYLPPERRTVYPAWTSMWARPAHP